VLPDSSALWDGGTGGSFALSLGSFLMCAVAHNPILKALGSARQHYFSLLCRKEK